MLHCVCNQFADALANDWIIEHRIELVWRKVGLTLKGPYVRLGLVASLARPGRNATGINFFSNEVLAKRLDLLRELVPAATRVAVLVSPANAFPPPIVLCSPRAPVVHGSSDPPSFELLYPGHVPAGATGVHFQGKSTNIFGKRPYTSSV